MRNTIFMYIVCTILIIPVYSFAVTDDANNLIINEGETYTLHGFHKYNVGVIINGTLKVREMQLPLYFGTIKLEAPVIQIGSKGVIDADGAGWQRGGPGKAPDAAYDGCDVVFSGSGGYGGEGTIGYSFYWDTICTTHPNSQGTVYGDKNWIDVHVGSSGGDIEGLYLTNPMRGGGAIKLFASSEIVVKGTLTANGSTAYGTYDHLFGGASGGGILLHAPRVILRGILSAKGTYRPPTCMGGGGGGGRIKIFYRTVYRNLFAILDVSGGNQFFCEGYGFDFPDDGTITIIDLDHYPFGK